VARKLEGLGALTKGDKSAGRGDTGGLGTNLENRSGQTALDSLLSDLKNHRAWQPFFPHLAEELREILCASSSVKQFLTRLQLVPFETQLSLLRNFMRRIKSNDVAMASQLAASTVVVKSESTVFTDPHNPAATVTVKEIECDHSMTFDDALALAGDQEGFRGFLVLRERPNNVFLSLPVDAYKAKLSTPAKRFAGQTLLANLAKTAVKFALDRPEHLAHVKALWEGKRQLAIDSGAHLEKFGLVNGSVFTVWKNIREALDPSYKPDDASTHHKYKQSHGKRGRGNSSRTVFEPNVKIQLLTTSDGEKLGGIRMTSVKPLQHSRHWAEGCNKKAACDFFVAQKLKSTRPQDLGDVYASGNRTGQATACRKLKCMVEGLSEVDKLVGSLRNYYGGGAGAAVDSHDEGYSDDEGYGYY